MLLRLFVCMMMLLSAAGCGPRYVDYFPCHDDGTPKPKIVVLPVIDHSGTTLPWNISQGFTDDIDYEMMNSGELYALSQQEVSESITKLGNIDFFSSDELLAKQFCGTDFVILMELFECSVTAYDACVDTTLSCKPGFPSPGVLLMKMRLRIIDIRCQTPRLVLQEIMRKEVFVPCSYEGAPRGPVAKAQHQFACELAQRIETMVRCAY